MYFAPWISCICPTYDRQERHPSLYAHFIAQVYPYKELLVLDDSKAPSPFFLTLKDPHVHYQHVRERLTIGTKRNRLNERAYGEIIAHFDDDDWYSAMYLTEMVKRLEGAHLVKLSVFNILDERDGSWWQWDTRRTKGPSGGAMLSSLFSFKSGVPNFIPADKALWGYGFSYVYRRELWEQTPFQNISRGEDYTFLKAARAKGAKLRHVANAPGLVLHTVHGQSTAASFPQKRIA